MTEPAKKQVGERPLREKPRVLFVALPSNESYADALVHPQHIGYRYLAAILRKHGYQARILNVYLDESELEDVLFSMDSASVERRLSDIIVRKTIAAVRALGVRPNIVGFSVTCRNAELVQEVAVAIKSNYPDAVVLLGGVYASLCAKELLSDNPEVDHILYGEAEHSIIPYVNALMGGGDLSDIAGLGWRAPDGEVVINCPAEVEADLDSLPFPAEDDLQAVSDKNNGKIRISSSRGCSGRCSFCSINAFGRVACASSLRARSARNIVDEMERLRDAYGINQFVFVDPEFIGSGRRGRDRALGLANELRRRELDIRFKIDCRADGVEFDTMSLLKDAGLYSVEIGVESFDDQILGIFNKKVSKQQNISALDCLCRLGLDVTMDYIFYTPWTTLDMMKRDLPILKGFCQNPRIRLFPVFRPLQLVPQTEVLDRAYAECGVWGDYRGCEYRLNDPRAHNIFRRHMPFCRRVRSLILNSPRIRPAGASSTAADASTVREYNRIGWLLKMLTIVYIEGLLSGDGGETAQCEKRLHSLRASMMSIYSKHNLPRDRHSVAR